MNLHVAQVIGLNTDQKAAQTISVSRNKDNSFFAVLDLASDDAFTKGRQILSEISDFYFEFEGSPSEKLNAAFIEAKQKLPQEDSSFLTASVSGKVLYMIFKGGVDVYLKRDNRLSSLLPAGSDSQLISGFLQDGDKLLLSTKSLISFLGEDLEKSLNLPLEIFEEEFSDRIGASGSEKGGLAGLVVEIEEESLVKEEQSESSIPTLDEEEYIPSGGKKITAYLLGTLSTAKRLFKNYFPKSGRGRLILATALIIVIALGVGYKYKASKDQQANALFNQTLQESKDDFSAAKGLATLNPLEAKNKLDSSKSKVEKSLGIKPKDPDALDLKKQIEEQSGSILQQSEASEFPLFLDLDLIKKNFRAQHMNLSAGKFLLLDPAVGTLISIDLSKKSNQILAGSDQLGNVKFASINGSIAFVYSEDKGILKVDSSNQKVTTVSKKDDEWEQIGDIYGFAGNIYLLNTGQIWKYLPTSDGYSDKREYFTKGTKADLSGSLRMQIESSIYVLKKGGEILRFTKGDKDNFSYEGLPSNVKDPKSIFVSSDTDNLYVLDSGNSRLLILTKIGSYKGQISGEKFGTASDLVVDEKSKKVYLLEGSKIFQVDLK